MKVTVDIATSKRGVSLANRRLKRVRYSDLLSATLSDLKIV